MTTSKVMAAALSLILAGTLLWALPGETVQETHSGSKPHAEQHRDHSFADTDRYGAMFESPERARWQKPDELIEALGVKPGMVVADVGAGTGYFAVRFARAVAPLGTVFAADIEPNMIVFLRDRADQEALRNLIPILASSNDPRLPDGQAELIFICNTWHHLSDRLSYARRLQAELAPGGRVVIVDFLEGELPVGPPPVHKLSAAQVRAEFEQAGYGLAGSPDLLPYQYVLVFEVAATP